MFQVYLSSTALLLTSLYICCIFIVSDFRSSYPLSLRWKPYFTKKLW